MPEKMPKDHYMVLNTLEATGAPLPACEFKNIARKFIGGDVEQGALTEWAASVMHQLQENGFVRRLAPISDKGPGFELTPEGRAAFAADPITVKKQDLSPAMASRMCEVALAQEAGRLHEIQGERPTFKALEERGLVTAENLVGGNQIIRLTDDGKDVCELMMDRMLDFPQEPETSEEIGL
jgi:DNA-binding PadR family transcriptional regulator